MGTTTRKTRYEKKYVLAVSRAAEVETTLKLHPSLFTSAYPPRRVNSLYLDTLDLQYYHTHVHGASTRHKVRIRWYGETFGTVTCSHLELKHRHGDIGFKEAISLPPLTVDESLKQSALRRLLRTLPLLPSWQHQLANLHLIALVSYDRSYWISQDRLVRLTVDANLTAYRLSPWANRYLARTHHFDSLVVELKYAEEDRPHAARTGQHLPWRPVRFSKYVNAVDALIY